MPDPVNPDVSIKDERKWQKCEMSLRSYHNRQQEVQPFKKGNKQQWVATHNATTFNATNCCICVFH